VTDLNTQTLFGDTIEVERVRWPAGHGAYPQLIERTLFGELALWRVFPWPWGHGSA
jgi:hypothetical protein